jgi:uncharacterized circularly permuted ATP-grasp superfamily protein
VSTPQTADTEPLPDYAPALGFFDELFDSPAHPRAPASALAATLGRLGSDRLRNAGERRDAIFLQQGITFDASGRAGGLDLPAHRRRLHGSARVPPRLAARRARLMGAYRAGNVGIANAVGTGVADDKAVYHYVPDMIRYYLGEEPILDNLPTWLLADPEQCAFVLERMHELVVKPTGESGGKGVFIGPHASEAQLEAQRLVVEQAPERWIAQQTVALSTVPTVLPDGSLAPRHVDLRPFAVYGEEIKIVPGGLTRVALREGSMIVNSSQGGGSKDTWVLAEDQRAEAADPGSQLAPPAMPGMRQPGWRGQAQQQQQARARG